MKSLQSIKGDIEQHVAVNEEGILACCTECREASGGSEQLLLNPQVEGNAERSCLLRQWTNEPGAEMAGKDCEARDALATQRAQLPEDDWYTRDWEQRLGDPIARHRTGARPQSSGDNHSAHGKRSESIADNSLD
jgi:hypothetical protein